MDRQQLVERLIGMLLDDAPSMRFQADQVPTDPTSRRKLLRSLMNVRPPMPLSDEYLRLQDELLSAERDERGVVHVRDLPATAADPRIAVWRGDICRLDADAIVNAANSAMLGCFIPCHGCIDNAIHSAAGLQLRDECARLMEDQGHDEPTGSAKMTGAYNLPCSHVIHTVGPVAPKTGVTPHERIALASCYLSCLDLAYERGLRSIAFPCISTGVFGYPNEQAAACAVEICRQWLDEAGPTCGMRIVFDVFGERDHAIYLRELGE